MKHLLPALLLLPLAACNSIGDDDVADGTKRAAVSEPDQLPVVRYYLIADT